MTLFDFRINYDRYENNSFLGMLNTISEALADQTIENIPDIINSFTGEVMNGYKFKLISHSGETEDIHGLNKILDLLPYMHKFEEIYWDNYLVYRNI